MEKELLEQLEGVRIVQKTAYQTGYDAGYRAKMEEVCKYSREDKSERCAECHSVLCTSCGYEKEGFRLCNECAIRKEGENPKIAPKSLKYSTPSVCSECGNEVIGDRDSKGCSNCEKNFELAKPEE